LKLGSILAIYFLFWVASAFLLLPFGVRTDEEVGAEKVAGQADSAPHRFDIANHVFRATILATLLFVIYYANWYFGWVSAEDLDFYH
jgi:predicted secreted protein